MKNRHNTKVMNLQKVDINLMKKKPVSKKIEVKPKRKHKTKASINIGSLTGARSYSNQLFDKKVDLNKEFMEKHYDTKQEVKQKLRKINSVRISGRLRSKNKALIGSISSIKDLRKTKFSNRFPKEAMSSYNNKPGIFEKSKSRLNFFSKSQSNFRRTGLKMKHGGREETSFNLPIQENTYIQVKKERKEKKISFEVNEKLTIFDTNRKRCMKLLNTVFGEGQIMVRDFFQISSDMCRELRNSLRLGMELKAVCILDIVNMYLDNCSKIFKSFCEEKEIKLGQRGMSQNLLPPDIILNTVRTMKTNMSTNRTIIEDEENVVEMSKLRMVNDQIKNFLGDNEELQGKNKILGKELRKARSKILELQEEFASNHQENDHNIHRMKIILNSLQDKLESNQRTIESLSQKLAWHEKEENSISYRLQAYEEKSNRFREISLMQLEEMNSIKKREKDLISVIKELRGRLMIKKMERSEVMTKESLDIFKAAENEYQNQLKNTLTDDYVFIKNSIIKDFKNFKEDQQKANDSYLRFSIENFIIQKTELRNNVDEDNWQIRKIRNDFKAGNKKKGFLKQIDLSNLRLYKANLANLFKYRVKNLSKDEVQTIINRDFSMLSLVRKVRAIFDSKWNEFCYYQDRRMYSHFSDFVYSWFQNFKLNLNSMKIFEAGNMSNTFLSKF